jgi:hypothetical protein
MFQMNLIMNLNGVTRDGYSFPPGNKIVPGIDDVGFANPTVKDFRLAPNSRYAGKGRNGKNIGSDLVSADVFARSSRPR